jgi:acyl-CoA thioesterase
MDDREISDAIDPPLRSQLFEKVKNIYGAPFSLLLGIDIISIKMDEIRLRMSLDRKMNSVGFAHGGSIFAIADQTFAYACNLCNEDQIALSSNIVYHKPGFGKELTTVSSRVSETNSVSTYSIMIYCDGKHIATATFVGFKVKGRIRDMKV